MPRDRGSPKGRALSVDAACNRRHSLRPLVGVSHEHSGVPAAACQSPLQASARSAAYARRSVHIWRPHIFPRESPGRTLAGGLASSREQESRALWLESQQPASIFLRSDERLASFFSVVRQWAVLPVVARSEQTLSMRSCPPAKVMEICRLPTCRVQVSTLLTIWRSCPLPTRICGAITN